MAKKRLDPNRPRRWQALLRRIPVDRQIVGAEVGVWMGEHAEALLQSVALDTLYLIDPYTGEGTPRKKRFHRKMFGKVSRWMRRRYGSRALVMREPSPAAADHFASRSLDFVYIDGRHDRDSVAADIAAWWPRVRCGGVLAGHDYNRGVKRAVLAAFDAADVRTTYWRCVTWWVYKHAEEQLRCATD